MRCHCLTASEVAGFLSSLVGEGNCLDADMTLMIEYAKSWDILLVCHNIFVARHINKDTHGGKKIEQVYALVDALAFEIQEGGDQFVNYLLRHKRSATQTLDDALVEIQKGLSEYDYAKAIRY